MPKRKRHRPAATTTPATPSASGPAPADPAPAIDSAVALFAERHRAQQEAERKAREAERAARKEAERLDGLRRAKDEAAARLKAVRRKDVIAPGEVERAEAAYTAAAADLVEAETGQRPTWAPARPDPEPEETPEPEAATGTEPDAEPGTATDL